MNGKLTASQLVEIENRAGAHPDWVDYPKMVQTLLTHIGQLDFENKQAGQLVLDLLDQRDDLAARLSQDGIAAQAWEQGYVAAMWNDMHKEAIEEGGRIRADNPYQEES